MQSIHHLVFLPLAALRPAAGRRGSMASTQRAVLTRHIATSGCYEPLIVRPIPPPTREAGAPMQYEILHGHTRAAILRRLGRAQAACLVWEWSDKQVLLWRATAHSLVRREKASERLAILRALLRSCSPDELIAWLPEDRATLERLREHDVPPQAAAVRKGIAPVPPVEAQPEAFTVFLTAGEKRHLRERLAAVHPDPAQALLQLVTRETAVVGNKVVPMSSSASSA